MELTFNGITIEYDKKDGNLAIEILEQLEIRSKNIMDFFGLEKVDNFKIKIWGDYEKFKEFTLPFLKENKEEDSISWVTAHTFDDNINMLPARFVEKIWNRKVDDGELATDAGHEFVHICQARCYGKNDCKNSWFWEALATNLGNPEHFDWVKKEYKKYVKWEEFDFEKFSDKSYKYVYCIGNYMLKNISHQKILDYVKNPDELEKDSEKILVDAKKYSDKTFLNAKQRRC